MTVAELIEALKKMPQGDEVRLQDGERGLTYTIWSVGHESFHGQDYVVIE